MMKIAQNPALTRRSWSGRKPAIVVSVLLAYGLIGLAAYWPIYPGDPSRLPVCACADSVQSTWFLRWVPYAISHGHNPFFSTWINYPSGANLAQNTLMPLLGLVTAPLTVFVSPVASFNLLAWLAYPLSGGSMYFVVRRLTRSSLGAFVAGLLLIGSPYLTGQASDHIMLSFLPLPPLILYALWQLLVEQNVRPRRTGLLLALEVIAQYLIEPEVLALTAVAAAICCAIALIGLHEHVTSERLRNAARGLLPAAATSAVVLAYPIWFLVFGPHRFSGPNFPRANPWRSDLLSLVLPTLDQRVVPGAFRHFAATTASGGYQEVGSYISVPLLLLLTGAAVKWRRDRRLAVTLLGAVGCWVLSLGPRLVVHGHPTGVPLPFVVLAHLPLAENILPGRFSLGMWLLVSIAAGFATAAYREELQNRGMSRDRLASLAIVVALAIASAVLLIPRWPVHSQAVVVPAPLARDGHPPIAANSVVLVYPYPVFPLEQGMIWQATSGLRFKIVGGYVQMVDPNGHQTVIPPLLQPPTVQEWMATKAGGGAPWPPLSHISSRDLQEFIRLNHIGVVLLDQTAVGAKPVTQRLTSALGRPTQLAGNLLLWQTAS